MDRKRKRGPVVGSSAARGWRKLALPESLFKTSEHEGLLSLEVLDASSEDYESLVRNLKEGDDADAQPPDEQGQAAPKKQKKAKKAPVDEDVAPPVDAHTEAAEVSATPEQEVSQTEKKKTKKKRTLDTQPQQHSEETEVHSQQEQAVEAQPQKKLKKKKDKSAQQLEEGSSFSPSDVPPAWRGYDLDLRVLRAVTEKGFAEPTPIQRQAFFAAIRDRKDLIGAAETGSGKTLAFGIPILQVLLNHDWINVNKNRKKNKLAATGLSAQEEEELLRSQVKLMKQKQAEAEDEHAKEEDEEEGSATEGSTENGYRGEGEGENSAEDGFTEEEEEEEEEEDASEDEADWGEDEGGGSDDELDAPEDPSLEPEVEGEDAEQEFNRLSKKRLREQKKKRQLARNDKEEDENDGFLELPSTARLAREEDAGEGQAATTDDDHVRALILTPTRELAMQVAKHLQAAAKFTPIKVVPIVGGISPLKQARLLNAHPEVVVATPGRLWELIADASRRFSYISDLSRLQFLVLDEADRMVEAGHYHELRSIFALINKVDPKDAEQIAKKKKKDLKKGKKPKADKQLGKPQFGASDADEEATSQAKRHPRQTFVFSATLLSPPTALKVKHKKFKRGAAKDATTVDSLMDLVNFQRKIETIDLTRKHLVVSTLTESKIECSDEDKDFYLYYFLAMYPGRTLVFVNSITCIKRLLPLLAHLQVPAFGLHANMQQKQRLKSLERFSAAGHAVLVATDVAARGLDIPGVAHVIHYQMARTTDLYVHRSGRTARAQKEGLSVMFVGPSDVKPFRKLLGALNREEKDIPSFPVDVPFMKGVRQRVTLARRLDKEVHKSVKVHAKDDWLRKAAKALDVDIDEDEDEFVDRDVRNFKENKAEIARLRAELSQLLSKPLVPMGTSAKYLTMSAALPQLLMQKTQPKDARKDVQDLLARRALAAPKERPPAPEDDDSDREDGMQNEEGGMGQTEEASLEEAEVTAPPAPQDRKRKQAPVGGQTAPGASENHSRKKRKKQKKHAQSGLSVQNAHTLRLDEEE